MRKNGQITVEAILIIGFFIALFMAISMPVALQVVDSGKDTSAILEMRTNTDMILSAIKLVRAGGPGSVRTVKIKSNYENIKIAAYDDIENPPNTLTYWVKWSSAAKVPYELAKNSEWGGYYKTSIKGIDSTGTMSNSPASLSTGSGQGNWKVKVINSATSTSPALSISSTLTGGDTIEITLSG